MSDLFTRLAAPFPPDAVSWRVGSTTQDKSKGMALAFIDARDVMDRLDDVCGPENWQDRYTATGAVTVCEIDVWIEGRGWVTKADGAGATDVEAEKGSLSDAFKRAAVRWGIGRYLYHLTTPWVPIKQAGRSYVLADEARPQLRQLLERDAKANAPRLAPAEEPQTPSGREQAAAALRRATSATHFRQTWDGNKESWKELLSVADYLWLTDQMKAEAAKWAPKPAEQKAAA